MCSSQFCKISKKHHFAKHLQITASETWSEFLNKFGANVKQIWGKFETNLRQIWNKLKRMWSNFEKNRKHTQRNWNEIKQCTKYWNTLSNVLGMQHVTMCLYYDMCRQNPGLHWLRYYIPIRRLLNQTFLGTRLGFEIQRPFETDSTYFLESHFYLIFYNFWSF